MCVCVADTSMWSVRIPVLEAANALALSSMSLGIMQLSTTTMATCTLPLERTRERA